MSAQGEFTPANQTDELAEALKREEQAIDLMSRTIAEHSQLLDEHEDLKAELERFKHDELTEGLVRRAFITESDRLRTMVHEATHPKGYDSAAVLMTDLIKLKKTNKKEGHYGGDLSLSGYARLLGELTNRISDIEAVMGRLGGDEFAITIAYPSTKYTPEALRQIVTEDLEDNAKSTTLFGVRVGDIAVSTADKEMKDLFKEADPKLPKTRMQKVGKFVVNKYYSTKRQKTPRLII